jgi:hypothetical protein
VDEQPPAPTSGSAAPVPKPAPASVAADPALSNTLLDSGIASLAAAIRLGKAPANDVSKDVWVRELPIAQKLLGGDCDCDQRNWLKHYIQTGQEAVSGSTRYPQSLQMLATLRRSNQDVASAPSLR